LNFVKKIIIFLPVSLVPAACVRQPQHVICV
jgi:hypothetical protein